MSYLGALGASPSTLDVVLTYLRAQSANTIVVVSDASGRMGIGGSSSYLVVGSAYYAALPAAVRAAYPLGATVISPLVPGDARVVASVGNLRAAIERALAPVSAVPSAQAPRAGMSKGAKIAIAVGILGGVFYVATRKGASR